MAIALVNKTTGTSDTGATTLAATAASHTTGNLIVVGVVWSNNVTASIPTDTAGNTYVSTTFKANNGTSDHVEIFYAKNVTGNASNVVTAHFSASATFRRIFVYQYSGCSTTAPFTTGEGSTGTAASTTSVVTGSFSTAIANSVLVAFMGGSGSESADTAGSGYTLENAKLGGDSNGEDRIVSATGSYTGGFSWTSSNSAWCAVAAFNDGVGGGGGGTTPTASTLQLLGVG